MAYDITSKLHKNFVENVRARRAELKLTLEAAGGRMGVSYGSYAQIENGRRMPSLDTVERVATALNANPLELLTSHAFAHVQAS